MSCPIVLTEQTNVSQSVSPLFVVDNDPKINQQAFRQALESV